MKNIWKDGIMGVVIGDALGCPIQFKNRNEVAEYPVTGMRGGGVFNLPAGSWTDDSSLTLALLDSIKRKGTIDLKHIMENFIDWLDNGEFTPFGRSFDIGGGTMSAICSYKHRKKPNQCGGRDEQNNGNGRLKRILPVCLFCYAKKMDDVAAINTIHHVGSLTHAHIRSNIACGLYYFMVRAILDEPDGGSIQDQLQRGLNNGFAYYEKMLADHENLAFYNRLRDLQLFVDADEDMIKSSGYVVDTLEAAVWSLITTSSFEAALLKAVNLGGDSDTVGAVTGGLAGLFYGCQSIPPQWIETIQRRAWIEGLCESMLDD